MTRALQTAPGLAILLAALAGTPHALGDTWDNSAGTAQWSTATNWVDNTEPTIGDFALFPNTIPSGQSVITLSSGEFALSLNFLNSYTLTGGNIQLGNGTIALGGWNPTINALLAGTGPITISGGGTLNLFPVSSNTYTGGTIVSGTSTTLVIRTNGALGFNTAPITLNGGCLRLDGSVNPTFIISRDVTLGTGGGRIDLINNAFLDLFRPFSATANALTLTGTGTAELNSTSTRTGSTTINGPLVRLNNAQALGTGTINMFNAGVLELANSLTYTMPTGMGEGATMRGAAGTSTYNGACNVFGTNATLSGGPTSNDTLILGTNGASVWNNGATSITTIGQGNVRLLSANTYAGSWAMNAGSLEVAHPDALGTGTTPIVVNPSGRLKLNIPSLSRDITLNNPGGGIELLQDCTVSGDIPIAPNAGFVPIIGPSYQFTYTGDGSTMTYNGILFVATASGARSFRVEGGADVTGTSTRVFRVGAEPGVLTISGAGSTWTNTGETWLGNSGGTGSLVVESGGTFTCPLLYVAQGDDGTAAVTGEGSLVSCNNRLIVGFASATGSLMVMNGGDVTASQATVGELTGASGTLTVSGAGSTLDVQGLFEVGKAGQGVLNVDNGGSASCLGLFLGNGAASSGAGTITGGLSTLNVGSAGVLMSQNGASSTLDLPGGIVDIHGNITDAGAGVSTIILDGATLDVHGFGIGGVNPIDNLQLRSGTLKNVGEINTGAGLTKAGPGTLYLNTPNAYGGPTVVTQGTLFVVNSTGSATSAGSVIVFNGGTLAGPGRVGGPVNNHGVVAPAGFTGNPIGTLTMLDGYSQPSDGALAIEIGSPTSFDRLSVAGAAALAGTLDVALLNAFEPALGDSFAIVSAAATTGTFGTLNLPALSGGHAWRVAYPAGQVILTVASACVADVDDGSGAGTPDGGVTIDDLLYYLAVFDLGDLAADVDDGTGTGTPDAGVTIDDLLYFLARFDAGC